MHRKLKWPAVVCCLLFLASPALAQLPLPRTPTPTPPPTNAAAPQLSIPPHPSPPPLPTPSPTAPSSGTAVEQNIPVVITYGDGAQTRVQITRGIMQPVGIPPNQPVTVTLFLSSGIPGTLVQVGLYDGGQIAAAALPSPPPTGGVPVETPLTRPLMVLADQTVRFNFQSGRLLGLYRALVTIGPKQYLLQFYAVKPRSVPPLPGIRISPPPGPSPPNTPPPG
jgi:hypothetical protein